MIEIRNLKKRYNESLILDDINLTIEDGEIYGLVGESGVGKSTLLECLNRLIDFEEGTIEVDGVFIESLSEKELKNVRKNFGMIFQNFSLLNRKNVYRNIALPMECWGYSKEEIDKRVKKYAELVGISEKLKSKPGQLSGGQKQRVAIARALTMDPKYLLCDECTSSLDPKTTVSILNLLASINKEMGITIIMVTHEMSVVQKLCDRMSLIHKAKIVQSGKVTEMFLDKSREFIELLGTVSEEEVFEGTRITMNLDSETIDQPVLFELSKKTKNGYSLVDSSFYEFQKKRFCSMSIKIDNEDKDLVLSYLKDKNIEYRLEEGGRRDAGGY